MARPKTLTLTLVVDPNGICVDQTTGGAGNLSLDGALISDGKYTSDTAQQIGLESSGNLSGVTFTVTGKGYDSSSVWNGSISEAITGPNATTVESTNYYTEITQIAVDGAVGTNVEIGPVDEAITKTYPLNWRRTEDIGLQAVVSGTINYDVDYTLSSVQDGVAPDWIPVDSSMTAATAAQKVVLDGGVRAIRVQANSGSDAGEVKLNIVQS